MSTDKQIELLNQRAAELANFSIEELIQIIDSGTYTNAWHDISLKDLIEVALAVEVEQAPWKFCGE